MPDELTPQAVTSGATVVVSFDQMLPTDRIRAVFSGVAGIGTHSETKDGNSRKVVEFTIPAEVIGVNIAQAGRDITVQYFLIRGGTREIPSRILSVYLRPLLTLPRPSIEGFDTAVLDISRLVGHERTVVNVWQFINRTQRVWLEFSGQRVAGGTYVETVYAGDLVNAAGETNGILAPTPVANLRLLRDGSDLPSATQTVRVNTIALASLPRPLINGVANNGTLDVSSLTTTGAM